MLAEHFEVAHRLDVVVVHRLVGGEKPITIRLESHAETLIERSAEAVGVGEADDDRGMSETGLG